MHTNASYMNEKCCTRLVMLTNPSCSFCERAYMQSYEQVSHCVFRCAVEIMSQFVDTAWNAKSVPYLKTSVVIGTVQVPVIR